MRVEELMSRKVHTCRPQDPLNEAARVLWNEDCGLVVVTQEGGSIAGVLTDRDLCMAAYTQGLPLHRLIVGEVMSREVVSIGAGDTLTSACERMSQNQVRRLPVVDREGRVVGLLSVTDLVRAAARASGIPGLPGERVLSTLAAISRSRNPEPTFELPAAPPIPALTKGGAEPAPVSAPAPGSAKKKPARQASGRGSRAKGGRAQRPAPPPAS